MCILCVRQSQYSSQERLHLGATVTPDHSPATPSSLTQSRQHYDSNDSSTPLAESELADIPSNSSSNSSGVRSPLVRPRSHSLRSVSLLWEPVWLGETGSLSKIAEVNVNMICCSVSSILQVQHMHCVSRQTTSSSPHHGKIWSMYDIARPSGWVLWSVVQWSVTGPCRNIPSLIQHGYRPFVCTIIIHSDHWPRNLKKK